MENCICIKSRRYPSSISLCECEGDVHWSMLYLYNSGKFWVLGKGGIFPPSSLQVCLDAPCPQQSFLTNCYFCFKGTRIIQLCGLYGFFCFNLNYSPFQCGQSTQVLLFSLLDSYENGGKDCAILRSLFFPVHLFSSN